MPVGLDILREAIRARARGELEGFLEDYGPGEANEIRRAATPGIAFPTDKGALIAKIPPSEEIPGTPSSASTWVAHKDWILEGPYSLPESAVSSISRTTGDICSILDRSEDDRIYGLVVGYVQSGKTANYTALLARAADMGFTFVIVLSGVLNDLRYQTQVRLMRDLTGDHLGWLDGPCIGTSGRREWILITGLQKDVSKPVSEEMPNLLEIELHKGRIMLGVVKKNVAVLEHLLDGIRRCDPEALSKHKVLIVDDEADHATVNTGGDGSEHEDSSFDVDDEEDPLSETDPSRTNMAIRQIINEFERTTYVGYTATPFANVLIDKDQEDDRHGKSLYPRDFVLSLPRPKGYFGPDTFFGDTDDPEGGGRYTNTVPTEEARRALEMRYSADAVRKEAVPSSLQTAMMDFILTGIAKDIRRKRGVEINEHHTMLIHIQWRNDDQMNANVLVRELFEEWRLLAYSTIGSSGREFRALLKERWENEFRIWDPSIETWSQIENVLLTPPEEGGWLGDVQVRMINSLTDETLDYSQHEEGLNVIAIGGNKLSRGLTLEGLTISYFLRRTKMYDTLMQMGRWFGFRHGYEDLVRVHATDELLSWFEWLVRVEESVRSDIARYEILGLTPEELAVRIPLHRTMKVTSSSKMKSAITSIADYQGTSVQSVKLPLYDEARLTENLEATTHFLEGLGEGEEAGRRMWCWRADSSSVAEYFDSLDLDGPPHAVFDAEGIASYLRKAHPNEEVFVAHAGLGISELSQGPDRPFDNDPGWSFGTRYIRRSQGYQTIEGEKEGTENMGVISNPGDMSLAMQLHHGVCLLVYLIAPGSQPKSERRMALPSHETPIVGIAIRFPARDFEGQIRAYAHVKGVPGNV